MFITYYLIYLCVQCCGIVDENLGLFIDLRTEVSAIHRLQNIQTVSLQNEHTVVHTSLLIQQSQLVDVRVVQRFEPTVIVRVRKHPRAFMSTQPHVVEVIPTVINCGFIAMAFCKDMKVSPAPKSPRVSFCPT